MNGIIFYSNTNQSREVAQYLYEKTGWALYDLNCPEQARAAADAALERAVLVFPVHCQNVPRAVEECLKTLNARYLAVVATYGKVCYGNVLHTVQRHYKAGDIVAAAYVPMQHAYLPDHKTTDLKVLQSIVQKLMLPSPAPVRVPRSYKNPLADLFPVSRSRLGVKISVDRGKCTGCGKCARECLFGGMANGKTNGKCIRCLKCAANCPTGAISYYNRLPMRLYLNKKPIDRWQVYL